MTRTAVETETMENKMETKITTNFGEAIIIKDKESGETRIDSLEVQEDNRRQGHGRGLLIEAIKMAKIITTQDKIFIVADSKTDDFETFDLVGFYEEEGFEIVDCSADCIVMEMMV